MFRISHRLPSYWLFLSLLSIALAAQSAETGATRATADFTPPTEGILWKIEKGGLPPSYLFGTIHSSDAKVLDLPPQVREALAKSTRLILEMRLDQINGAELQNKLFLPADKNLAALLGKEDFQQLFNALSEHGVVITAAMRFKPWVAMTILSFPKDTKGDYLDLSLEKRAESKGMPVYGLESLDEQLGVFEKFSLPEQLLMLRATLAELDKMPSYLEQMHTFYLARDLKGIQNLSSSLLHSDNAQEEALTQLLWKRLLTDRNHVMLERMQTHLLAGKAFVAVGTLHLTDQEGLVTLLRRQGYQLTKLY